MTRAFETAYHVRPLLEMDPEVFFENSNHNVGEKQGAKSTMLLKQWDEQQSGLRGNNDTNTTTNPRFPYVLPFLLAYIKSTATATFAVRVVKPSLDYKSSVVVQSNFQQPCHRLQDAKAICQWRSFRPRGVLSSPEYNTKPLPWWWMTMRVWCDGLSNLTFLLVGSVLSNQSAPPNQWSPREIANIGSFGWYCDHQPHGRAGASNRGRTSPSKPHCAHHATGQPVKYHGATDPSGEHLERKLTWHGMENQWRENRWSVIMYRHGLKCWASGVETKMHTIPYIFLHFSKCDCIFVFTAQRNAVWIIRTAGKIVVKFGCQCVQW